MIFALVLGCFAGAVAGEVGYWGKDSSPELTLIVIDENTGEELLDITNAYISNETGSDYLYLKDDMIASSENITTYLKNKGIKGYVPSSDYKWKYRTDSESPKDLFSSSGEISILLDFSPYIISDGDKYTWNYSASDNLTLYGSFSPNKTIIELDVNTDDDDSGYFPKPDYLNEENEWNEDLLSGGTIHTWDSEIVWEWGYVEPVRKGYKFVGWAVDELGTAVVSKTYLPDPESNGQVFLPLIAEGSGDGYEIVSSDGEYKWIALENERDVTLYAVWEEIEEPTGGSSAIILIGSKSSSSGSGPHIEYKYVTFDANGGLGEMEKQQFTGGQTKALSANQFTFAGKNFAGWALEPTGMVTYSDGQEIMVEEDLTLYAVWVEPIPENPDVGGEGEDETGIPTWLAVLLVAVVLAILIAVLVYFLVIRRGAA